MHLNTKFGSKMLGSVEDIIWTNTDILTLHCDLDLECSDPCFFFFYKTLGLMKGRAVGGGERGEENQWMPRGGSEQYGLTRVVRYGGISLFTL